MNRRQILSRMGAALAVPALPPSAMEGSSLATSATLPD